MTTTPTDEEQLLLLLERSRQPWVDGEDDAIIDRSIGAGFGYREPRGGRGPNKTAGVTVSSPGTSRSSAYA